MTAARPDTTAAGGAAGRKAAGPKRPNVEAVAARVREGIGGEWAPRVYRSQVLRLRTRSHGVTPAARGASVEVLHTLLGIELKVGRKRQSCPDLATARYLSVFARAGCAEVAVPYDITQISRLADALESSWQRMLLLAEHHSGGRGARFASRVRALLAEAARREVEEAGAGPAVPEFNQNTRQRRPAVQPGRGRVK